MPPTLLVSGMLAPGDEIAADRVDGTTVVRNSRHYVDNVVVFAVLAA
jgi:hypothetical protein